jgi:hypothetical protein
MKCSICDLNDAVEVGVRYNDIHDEREARLKWEQEHPPEESPSGLTFMRASDLFYWPDIPWEAYCGSCGEADLYVIPIEETHAATDLLDWTVHLMEKNWILATNWREFVRNQLKEDVTQ